MSKLTRVARGLVRLLVIPVVVWYIPRILLRFGTPRKFCCGLVHLDSLVGFGTPRQICFGLVHPRDFRGGLAFSRMCFGLVHTKLAGCLVWYFKQNLFGLVHTPLN
jgi:hypothetical protein